MDKISEVLNSSDAAIITIIVIVVLVMLFIASIVKIFEIIYTWKLFKKAGKGGWESLIPFYNKWVLVEISESNWWWFLLLVIPNFVSVSVDITEEIVESTSTLVGLAVVSIAVAVCGILSTLVVGTNIAKKFNKSTGFGVLIALIPIIGIPIIAFSNDKYDFDLEVPGNGIFGGKPVNKKKINKKNPETKCEKCKTVVNGSMKYCPNCGSEIKQNKN